MSDYVWLRFNNNQLLWADKYISPADIAKIIRIGVQIDYNNNLIFDNKISINKKNLNKILKLTRSKFELFFKKSLMNNIFYIDNLDYSYRTYNNFVGNHIWSSLVLNKEFIRKGYSNRHWNEQTYSERIKLYIKPTKELFENATYTQVGNLFLLIPFLDFKDNSISIEDAMEHLGYNKEKKKRFIDSFNNLKYVYISDLYITISKELICFKPIL